MKVSLALGAGGGGGKKNRRDSQELVLKSDAAFALHSGQLQL